MFSYYGSKSKIVHLYPAPKHSLIIEPFAGSARYALKYFERDVILIDKYKVIIDVWKYLQQASEKDILGLPILKFGENLRDFDLSDLEKKFLGFNVSGGVARPQMQATYLQTIHRPNNQRIRLQTIAKNLYKIRHWKFINGEYDCVETKATWFIDPPYFKGGEHYARSSKKLDFSKLATWAKNRLGQIIVCENASAQWLSFLPLARSGGTRRATTEVFWTNEKVEIQASLFT